jgi:LacI family transcriptional regulator
MAENTRTAGKKLTYVDIARLVGVGASTVSRVLNNSVRVAPNTREKILNVIKATGYKPSSAARMLVRRRHETIGLIILKEQAKTHYGARLIEGISEKLTRMGLRLAMSMVSRVEDRAEDIETLPLLKMASVDGVILDVAQIAGDIDAVAGRLGMPYIFVNPASYKACNSLVPDDTAISEQTTQYLIERGHRRIAYIAYPTTPWLPHYSHQDRLKGYTQAMLKAKLQPIAMWENPLPDSKGPTPDYIGRVKFVREQNATAIVAYDAMEGVRILFACYQLGLRVPEDISVIACDYDPIALVPPVPITCFNFDRSEMGKLAVQMLDRRIENNGEDIPTMVLKGTLIEGETVKTVLP